MATFDPLDPIKKLGRDSKAFLDDPFNKPAPELDSGQRVPVTKQRTAFSLTLHASSGNRRGVIGAVKSIAWGQSQNVDEVYEVNSLTRGLPVELVPQLLQSRTIKLNRYELYDDTIFKVFGNPGIMLIDARTPISMRFMWKRPEPSTFGSLLAGTTMEVWEFSGCRITSLAQNLSAEGDPRLYADADLIWMKLQQIA